jgi:predicted GNAT family N-acyltransferase
MQTPRSEIARTSCAWSTATIRCPIGLPVGPHELVFRAELDPSELRDALDLRRVVFQDRGDYLIDAHPGLHPAEDPHDAVAHHFACSLDGATIAAARFSPALDGRFEAESLAPLPGVLDETRDDFFQVSRVVVREDFRKRHVTEALLYLACRWMTEHLPRRSYFALCLPPLARFYEHFGAEIVVREPIVVPERHGHEYLFIRGELAHTAATTRNYIAKVADGWDLARCRLSEPANAKPSHGVRA